MKISISIVPVVEVGFMTVNGDPAIVLPFVIIVFES